MEAALTGLAVACLLAITGLIPYLAVAVKAALVAFTEGKHQTSINTAAETLAIRAIKDGVDAASKVDELRARLPDAMKALNPANETLRDVLAKAAVRVGGALVVPS